ncbi:MAG: HAD family phosphatase [Alphaproteobacteria bacterium]|nr:HAD family phosphatase [Alphaproteobacteria bacterium]
MSGALPAVWVLDLDGTLLGPDHQMAPEAVAALAAAHAQGVHVVIATGRILAATLPALAALPFRPWLVCCGGQTVLAPDDTEARVTRTLDPAHVADALARALPEPDVAIQLYTATTQAMWRPNAAGRFLGTSEGIDFTPLDVLPEAPDDLVKIVFTAEPEVALALDARFAGELPYSYTPTGRRYRDVLPRGVDKGVALRRLLARTGWPADRVLAAGDNANDLPLFAEARWRVAVVGRCPPLVALATHTVTDSASLGRILASLLPGPVPRPGGTGG